jgi:hypothetical protein
MTMIFMSSGTPSGHGDGRGCPLEGSTPSGSRSCVVRLVIPGDHSSERGRLVGPQGGS